MTNLKVSPEQCETVSPYFFVKYRQIKNERGFPLMFKDRMFLIDILEDQSDLQCILKAPQIGMTVLQLVKSMWFAYFKKKDIIYTLPTEGDVQDMAGGKINRIIAQNPILLDWTKDHDTVSQKNVGKNIIYYRGTYVNRAAMMVSSQLNIHDEVDASNKEVIIQYETRLQGQIGGMRWYFSHPSVTGAGIDEQWQKSDQKEWFILCSNCNEWQFMEWPDSINQEKGYYQCKFCEKELSDDTRRRGEWRKKYQKAEYSGYHVSQLICPWIPASKIIKDFKEKDPQYFHNFVLALPYSDSASKVTLDSIKDILNPNTARKGRVIFGVDTGIKIRWTCGDENGLFNIGEVDSYEDLQREVNKHKDWVMVIDQGGDIIGVRKFAEDNPGKVFLCFFQHDKKSMQLIKYGDGEEYGRVMVDRNRLIQLVVDEMNNKLYSLNGDLNKWWNLWLHWSHMFRTIAEDKLGNLVYVWERSDRNDYALAMCYWRVGTDRFAQSESTFEGKSEHNQIDEAPEIVDGKMPMFKLTMPEISERSDDWRHN